MSRNDLGLSMRLAPVIWLWAATAAEAAGPAIQGFQNRAGTTAAVAGDVIDLLGANLASESASATGWPLPLTLASTQVFCNSFPAPILSVSPDKVRIQLPWELAGVQSAQVRVVRDGQSSEALKIPLVGYAPAILGLDAPVIAPGKTVTLRVIGLGPRDRNPVTGSGPTADAPGAALIRFMVWIGGTPAPVTTNGLAQGDAQKDSGVQEVSVQVPFNVPAGENIPLQIQIAGVQSPSYPVTVQASQVQISLTPPVVQVPLGATQAFAVSVQGSDDTKIQWSVDPNGYSNGTYWSIYNGVLSSLYAMPAPNWTIIRASHSSGAFASALVQLVAQDKTFYRIVPDSPVVAAGESITLTLVNPDGAPVSGVVWDVSDGFNNLKGNIYTAPPMFAPPKVNVLARLPGKYGFLYDVAATTVVIDPPRSQITGTSPAVGHIGEALSFQGVGLSARVVYAWFTGADGSWIRSSGRDGIVVPHGAVSGPVRLELNGGNGGANFLSPSYPLVILPRLRLHSSRQRVSSGESIQIAATAPDVPGQWPLTWRADLGSVDTRGVFLAPNVTQPVFARIWACLQQNTECATTVVEVVPLRLEPDPLILNRGEAIQLKAWQGGAEVAATWKSLTPNVSVTTGGKLTAGSGPFDGGLAVVSATSGGVTQSLDLSVRTAGAISTTAEFYDWLGYDNNSPYGRLALGVFSGPAAINGNWIYTVSRSLQYYRGAWLSTWLDVYQLDEHLNPVWIDSVEAPHELTGGLYVAGNRLYVAGQDGSNVLLCFDISNGRPILQSRQTFEGDPYAYRPEGLSFTIPTNPNGPGPVILQIRDYSSGASWTLPVDYTPVGTYSAIATGNANWVAVTFNYSLEGASYETVVFDITGPTAVPIAILPSGGFNQSITVLQDLLVVGGDVYQVSGKSVTLASQLPAYHVLDADPVTKRLLMEPAFTMQEDGYRVVDLSDPGLPRTSATAVHSKQWTSGKLGPDYFVLLNGPQNVGVYPIAWSAGVRKIDSFPASPWMNDLRARDGYLYWTGPGWGARGRSESFGIFEIDDISSAPANVAATMDRPGDQVGWAIELNQHFAYVGTDTELIVYDISSPTAPVQGVVIPSPAISLALVGNYLYAGSNSGKSTQLLIYDVSDPANPKLANSMSLPEFAYGIGAQPGLLALALGKSGLAVYSLSNPAAPVFLAQLGGTVWDVQINQNLLYAAGDYAGLLIYDFSSPKNYTLASQTTLAAGDETYTPGYPAALSVSLDSRGIAWVCSAKEGRVYGLDVRDPGHPRHISEVATGMGVLDYISTAARVWNGRLYVAGNDAAFDVNAPQNVGLYEVRQPRPGQVLPDRYTDHAPVAQDENRPREPLKARILHGNETPEDSAGKRLYPRAFRADRPTGDRSRWRRQ